MRNAKRGDEQPMATFTKKDVKAFWNWFREVALSLEQSNFGDAKVLREVDRRLFNIDSRMNWEIGPGSLSSCQLVLSPNFNKDLVATCKAVLDLAPSIERWSFLLFKPRKVWNDEIILHDVGGQAICLNTSSWHYVMLRYPSNETEILIAANQNLPIEEGSRLRWLAGALILEAMLGEKIVMDCVHSWKVFDVLEPRFRSSAKELKSLPAAFGLPEQI